MSDWERFTERFKPRVIMPNKPTGDAKTLSGRIIKLHNLPERYSDRWWKREMKRLIRDAKILENKSNVDMPVGFVLGFLAAIIAFVIYLAI